MEFLVVDLGIALGFAGLLGLLLPLGLRRRLTVRRSRAFLLLLLGSGILVGGLLLPPPAERRAIQSLSHLDDWLPRYEFVERHEIVVHASPEAAYRAVLAVTAREVRLFRFLAWLRSPRLPWTKDDPVSVLNPSADRPLLESAVRGGFVPLTDDPPKEAVLGAVIVAPREVPLVPVEDRPSLFRQLNGPGFVKAAINFRIVSGSDGTCTVITETRVHATDPKSLRRFAAYWRTIYPGSWTIRWFWLRAIRDRAERAPLKAWVGVPS